MEAGDGRGGGAEEEEEQVMSEVHLGCPPRFSGLYVSRFSFSSRPLGPSAGSDGGECSGVREQVAASSSSCGSPDAVTVDEDGDLVLDRRRRNRGRSDHVLTVQHGITSSLRSVGLQVWKAALLLTDFVLHKSFTSSEFNGVTAIEIGAGTGLVGLALARVAKKIFITAKACVRELDWKMSWPPPVFKCDSSDPSSKYLWYTSEIEAAEKATTLFAADVIYSDDLTDLFFSIAKKLMSHGAEKVLYLTLEKRYNFSMDELDVVANGYKHFRSFFTVQDESGALDDNSCRPDFVGEQMDLAEVPQYIREYDRGKDLEMWKIMYNPNPE
uniref:Methyltransferase-like protein 22 n=1 Tax=Oryza nivara TaxID=4536 RepID=A0A0E0HTZ2_ORYNI